MQRRTVIKNFIYLAGGVALLPSCLNHDNGASIPLRNLKLGANDEQLLGEVVGTIIPATDTPGAKDLGVHQFLMLMLDDCYSKEDGENFTKGLKELNDLSQKQNGKSFMEASTAQREALLTSIEAEQIEKKKAAKPTADKTKKEEEAPIDTFYRLAKNLTIQGYMNSKYVMTNITKYELVPGRFKGCVPVPTSNKV